MSKIEQKWDSVVLRDLCDQVQYGYTASAEAAAIGPKFLRITDIVPDRIEWDVVPYCEIDPAYVEKYLLYEGDIVIARTGATTGYAKYIKKRHPGAVFASYLVRLRLKNSVNKRYIGFIVESDEYKRFIFSNIGGAAQPNANAQILTSFHLPLPTLKTQNKIASILSAYDDLIENNNRRIKILEEMAQAIYKGWFVNFRFPGHEKVKMVKSKLGMIPEGWEVVKFKDLVDCIKDSTDAGEHLSDRLYVPIDCIPKRSLTLLEANSWEEAKSSLILFQKNDILFGAMRPYFHKVCIAPFDGITRTTCFVLRPKLPELYTYSILTAFQDETVGYANAHSQGATIPYAVWDGLLSELNVLLPVHDILEKFNEVIAPMLQVFQSAYPNLQNLRKTRALLLPKLISGEIDVEEMDIKAVNEVTV